jgi:hypothetical protein
MNSALYGILMKDLSLCCWTLLVCGHSFSLSEPLYVFSAIYNAQSHYRTIALGGRCVRILHG